MAAGALKVVESSTWLDQVLEDFERDMLRRDLAPNTVRIYRGAIDDLFEAMRARGLNEITQLTRDVLERWQDELRERGNSAASRSLKVNAVKQMLRWAADHDLVDFRLERALAKVKVRQREPRPLPARDFELLKAYLLPRRPRMNLVALRDRALFACLVTSSARVSEVLQMGREEFMDAVVIQKGGYEKTLRMPPVVAQLIADYLRGRVDDSPWLWISHRTNTPLSRLTPPGVLKIWKKLARKLNIQPFTTHQLRHTAATELLDAEVSDRVIADHLGHHGLRTIHNYTQVRERQRQKVLDVMEDLISVPRPAILRPLRRRPRTA